jgi:hypothetical protein
MQNQNVFTNLAYGTYEWTWMNRVELKVTRQFLRSFKVFSPSPPRYEAEISAGWPHTADRASEEDASREAVFGHGRPRGRRRCARGRLFFPPDSRERASTHQNVGTSNGQARKFGGLGGGGGMMEFCKLQFNRSSPIWFTKTRYPYLVPVSWPNCSRRMVVTTIFCVRRKSADKPYADWSYKNHSVLTCSECPRMWTRWLHCRFPPCFKSSAVSDTNSVVEPYWFIVVPVPNLEKFRFRFRIQQFKKMYEILPFQC